MSDTDTPRDETTGQFTPNTDGLFGREAEEAAAGYKPMPGPRDPEWKGFESAEDAADALSASRNEDQAPVEVSYRELETGEKADGHETVTVERAAADLAAYRADRIQSAAQSISADFAAEIDRMRGEAIKANPEELGKHYGVDPALAAEAHEPENVKAADPDEAATSGAVDEMDGLDPETRKALKIPQVRQALEQEFAKADQARTHLESTIQAGQQMLQATVAALAPQLDGMPIEHWPQAIQMLSQVDPVRGQLVADTLQRWSAMQQADQQIKAQAAHEQAQEFRAFKAAEDAKLAESLGGDRGLVQQYAPKVQSYFKSLGMTEAEMWALANDRTANSALGQQVLLDALRFREIMAAPKAVPTREIPAVQRPGTKSPIRNNDSSTRLRGLEAQFASAAGHDAVRLAAEITQTRRASRRG